MNLRKTLLAGAIGVAMLALPFVASASVNNVLFDNGTGNTTVSSGSSLNVHLFVTSSGTDVESILVKFPGAGGMAEQGVCYDINPDQIGTSPVNGWDITFPVVAPVNSGTWPVSFATYGIAGDGADNTCSGSVGFGPTSFSGRVTVVADNSSGTVTQNSGGSGIGGSSSWQVAFAQLQAQMSASLASLNAAIAALVHPTTPAPSGVCTTLAQYTSMATPNARTEANVKLQGYLLSQGASIPALAAGASFGFDGPQTQSAVAWFSLTNHCN